MKETSWERLHRIAHDRVAHLGLMQDEFKSKGGPSPAWYRRINTLSGPVTSHQREALDRLDVLCLWPEGTARRLVQEGTAGLSKAVLDDQEHELVYGDDMRLGPHIRAFQTAIGRHLMNLDDATAAQVMRKVAEDLGLDLS